MFIREYSDPSGKGKKPMPLWARIVAAGIGLLMLTAGAVALVVVRPLEVQFAVGSFASASVGLDLVIGAVSRRWPLLLQWMPFI